MKFTRSEWKKTLKTETLMVIKGLYISIFLMGLFSCSTSQDGTAGNAGEVISIAILNAMPHCGGAPPDPNEIYPIMEDYIACTLSIHKENPDGSRGKKVGEMVTNEEGEALLSLKKGKYQLWKPSKLLPFSMFMEKETTVQNEHYEYSDEACFKEWYGKPDFDFEVVGKEEFIFAYYNRCFTSAHPCMMYIGPLPP